MKKLVKACFVIFISFVTIPSCVKNSAIIEFVGSNHNSGLSISKPIVKRGEPLWVSTKDSNNNSITKWAVDPSAGIQTIPANNQAIIIFSKAGFYRITAHYYTVSDTLAAFDSSSSQITVNDSIYIPPPPDSNLDTASLAGDQITLIPVSASDSGFLMLAKTGRLYNCTPYLAAYGYGQTSTSLMFDFRSAEVVEGNGGCIGVKNQGAAFLFFNPLDFGLYNVSAEFNQINYQGTLKVTDSNYTFIWNYSSGIIISPLQLKKH